MQRKKSAPALLVHKTDLPPLPPRSKEVSEPKPEGFKFEPVALKSLKGHHRNRSADFNVSGLVSEGVEGSNQGKSSGKKAFKKQHRRMKSHETVTAIYNQSHANPNSDLGAIDNPKPESTSEAGLVSKDTHDSSGKFLPN